MNKRFKNHHETLKQAQETRVTKKFYIVFKYSKLLNKYKMCSNDLHIRQYTHCPFRFLYTFPTNPRNTLTGPRTIHISFLFWFFSLLFWISCESWQLSIGQRAQRRYTWTGYSVGWRRPTTRREVGGGGGRGEGGVTGWVSCWWYEQIKREKERVNIQSQLIP